LNLTRTIGVTIYCYEINFIVTSKSRTQKKHLIVIDQLWHLVRYVGIVDASSHGVGGVVFGKLSACTPTVFRWQWPKDIRSQLVSFKNPKGTITNSDLEMAGLLLLWLTMEGV